MTAPPSSELLGDCKPGFSGTITGFTTDHNNIESSAVEQLREMGFAEDLPIEILHQNPFGKDPIAVRVGAMTIALRRREAKLVQVAQVAQVVSA